MVAVPLRYEVAVLEGGDRPEVRGQFLHTFREASGIILSCYMIAFVGVAAGQVSIVIVIKAISAGHVPQSQDGFDAKRLLSGAAQSGTRRLGLPGRPR
jgi:hypothetical protein